MRYMFRGSSFNQAVGLWSVGRVRDMGSIFRAATVFDQDLNAWETSGVTNMNSFFYKASTYNQPLNAWECVNRHSNL